MCSTNIISGLGICVDPRPNILSHVVKGVGRHPSVRQSSTTVDGRNGPSTAKTEWPLNIPSCHLIPDRPAKVLSLGRLRLLSGRSSLGGIWRRRLDTRRRSIHRQPFDFSLSKLNIPIRGLRLRNASCRLYRSLHLFQCRPCRRAGNVIDRTLTSPELFPNSCPTTLLILLRGYIGYRYKFGMTRTRPTNRPIQTLPEAAYRRLVWIASVIDRYQSLMFC